MDGIRWSAALAYLNPARHRVNLTIRANCHVARVLFEPHSAQDARCCGQVASKSGPGGETFVVEGDEVVLSAGPVGSPHLLMLSGVGPAGQLQEAGVTSLLDLPGVGQNLRDHPHAGVTWKPAAGYTMDPYLPRH